MSNFSKRNFRDTEIKELINQYKQHDCLWNINSPDYKNMSVKQRSWSEIADYFQKDINEVKLKIQYLRTAYVHQKRKVDASRKSGFETPYKPSLFYYNEFNFLDNMVIWRKYSNCEKPTDVCLKSVSKSQDVEEEEFISIKNVKDDYLKKPLTIYKTEAFSEPELNLSSSKNPICSSPKIFYIQSSASRPGKRKSSEKINLNKSAAINVPLTSSYDNPKAKRLFISFGKTIALQLQHLPLEQAMLAMSEIHTILTKATLEHKKAHESWSQSESEDSYSELTEKSTIAVQLKKK